MAQIQHCGVDKPTRRPFTWGDVLALGLIVSLLYVGAVAAPPNPHALFTDNIVATGPSSDVTRMEQVLLDHLNSATVSIDAALYGFNRTSIRDALIAAKGRGVAVRVVTDDEAYNESSHHPNYAALEAAGIPVVNDGRSSKMHNKFFVIDGEVVWTGSANMSNGDFTLNHNNSLVLTSAELAAVYTTEFEEMFVSRRFGTDKSDNKPHAITYDGFPLEIYFSPTDGAMAALIEEVNAAENSIHFSIFQFNDSDLRDALIARIDAGVAVIGLWDEANGASSSVQQALCDAGAFIKIENFAGQMHNKFMIIDANGSSPRVISGSMNWTAAGAYQGDENTLIIHQRETAQAYLAAFQEMYNALGPETYCRDMRSLFLPILFR